MSVWQWARVSIPPRTIYDKAGWFAMAGRTMQEMVITIDRLRPDDGEYLDSVERELIAHVTRYWPPAAGAMPKLLEGAILADDSRIYLGSLVVTVESVETEHAFGCEDYFERSRVLISVTTKRTAERLRLARRWLEVVRVVVKHTANGRAVTA